ncbi:MAG: hypothetical protein V8T87_10605 [Victivallales bacterium]
MESTTERIWQFEQYSCYFQRWEKEGFFLKLWKKGLAEYDDMEGIRLEMAEY